MHERGRGAALVGPFVPGLQRKDSTVANDSMQGGAPERGQWKSRLGFVLAAAGSAVGLGNIWKFPYITGENGGGLFVIIYLLCIALVGLPVLIGEILIGRVSQRSPVQAYADLSGGATIWKVVGWMGVLTGFVLLSYYSVVAGWAFNYIELALTNSFSGQSAEQIGAMFGELFGDFGRNVLWHGLFMGITIAVVVGGVQRGIELASRILMPALFVLMAYLMVYASMGDGFGEAARFLFAPKPEKLSAGGVLEALGHSFFTLSVGMGALITYGSYLSRKDDAVLAGMAISVLDTAVALMACLTMFPFLFSAGLPAEAGPGMVFISMPTAFTQMTGGMVLGVAFFVLLLFAALTSAISLLEVVVATLMDMFQMRRIMATLGAGVAIFAFGILSAKSDLVLPGIGKNVFDALDWLVSNVLLPLGGLAIAVFVGWIMPRSRTHDEFVTGSRLAGLYGSWLFLIRYVVPVAITLIFLHAIGLI